MNRAQTLSRGIKMHIDTWIIPLVYVKKATQNMGHGYM